MKTEESPPAGRRVGLVIVSTTGIVESLNAEAQAELLRPREQLIGRPIVEALSDIADEATLLSLSLKFSQPLGDSACSDDVERSSRRSVRCEALPGAESEGRWLVLFDGPTSSKVVNPAVRPRRARLRRTQLLAMGAAFIALLAAAAYLGIPGTRASTVTAPAGTLMVASASMASTAAPTQPAHISVIGTIETNDTIGVSAPFDGIIKEKHLVFDTEVEQDQLLLILDSTDVTQHIQEAKVAMLKAGRALQELERWDSGAEVSRARRTFMLARQQVEQTERKAQEIDMLVKKGILARSEYDGVAEQLNGFKAQLAAASDDLKATQDKASKGNLEIARIEHEQAKAKYDELARSLSLARIVAPRAGILSKAPPSSGQAPATLDAGSRITKGQLLFNVALTGRLRVSAKVDEADIVGLATGVPVEVSIDSQDIPPLQGRLASISAQAVQSGNGIRSALFDVSIDLPELDEAQRKRLRVGMSCTVRIATNAVAVPPVPASTSMTQLQPGG